MSVGRIVGGARVTVDVGEGVGMNGLKLLQADIKLATSRVIMICFLILFSFLKMRLL